jgi:hypothetical protein
MCINELASCWLCMLAGLGWLGWLGWPACWAAGEDSKEYSCMHFRANIKQCDVHAANIHNSQLRE